jgi:hypothetical protein
VFHVSLFRVAGGAIAPVISKLSDKYPNIPVYKVDIDLVSVPIELHGNFPRNMIVHASLWQFGIFYLRLLHI